MNTNSPIQILINHRTLLQMEYATEKENFRRQTEAAGIARKVKRGDAWLPVKFGRTYYNSLNQLSLEALRCADDDIEHNFEYNRPVCFFTIDGSNRKQEIHYFAFTAHVSYAEADRMVLIMDDGAHVSTLVNSDKPVGIQLSFDETSYQLMFAALDRVISARTGRTAYLRDLFHTNAEVGRLALPEIKMPWLNSSQEHAVNEMLAAKDVMIVHGPPGTGKTTTMVEGIYETLRRENQVLVCAQSNMAVDWISEKLVDRGLNVLRIGNPTRVNDKMLSFTYERRFEAHPDYPQLWSIRKAMRQLREQRPHNNGYHQKMDRLRSRATELELRINNDIFSEARVIASTLTGAANRVLEGMKFGTLFIDEAAQALEAACWIAIRKASRVVLAGDHCQLPPTVKSIAALKGGLGVTLMERVAKRKPETVTLLTTQYRMNERIMRFSADWFYGGNIVAAPQTANRSILDMDRPMTWMDTAPLEGKEEFTAGNFGRINRPEAELTIDTLEQYIEKIGKQRMLDERIDIGIISPYRAQVQYLRQMIKQRQTLKPYRKLLTVNTVDGFQGQERDVIIVSLVRSNDNGEIGFLRDLRRMNVAITRARMKLIILGDTATLTRHPFYKKLFEYATADDTVAE